MQGRHAQRGETTAATPDLDTDVGTLLDQATDPSRIKPGAFVVAGHDEALAVVEIVDVRDDGVVHVRQLPEPVSANVDRLAAGRGEEGKSRSAGHPAGQREQLVGR